MCQIRQLLQILTLVWQADGPIADFADANSLPRFLYCVLQWTSSGSDNTLCGDRSRDVLPDLVTALAALELATKRDQASMAVRKLWGDSSIWVLMGYCNADDVVMISRSHPLIGDGCSSQLSP